MKFTESFVISIFTDSGPEQISAFSDMTQMDNWAEDYQSRNPCVEIFAQAADGSIIDESKSTADVFMIEDEPFWHSIGLFTDPRMADIFEGNLPSGTTYRRLTLPLNPPIET